MEFEQALADVIRAKIPGIYVSTLEEERAVFGVMSAIANLRNAGTVAEVYKYPVYKWSSVSMVRHTWERKDPMVANSPCVGRRVTYLPDQYLTFSEVLEAFLTHDLVKLRVPSVDAENQNSVDDAPMELSPAILIICDRVLNTEFEIRLVREVLWKLKGSCRTVIFMGEEYPLPSCLAVEMASIPLELPDLERLRSAFKSTFKSFESTSDGAFVFDPLSRDPFLRACLGLTLVEARNVLAKAVVATNSFNGETVKIALKEKAKLIRSCAALEYREVQGSLDDIGGLAAAKRWVREVDDLWRRREEAEKYGCSIPSGLLLAGIPGTGKTYLAERLAGTWGLPLFVLDVGSLFGPLLGSTEAAFRRFKTVVKACCPCVVFIDEMEKALGGSGDIDGGASERLKGSLLTWLQDKPSDVFLVASANDVMKFRRCPEILRAGRFDQIFWVDLPGEEVRREVFCIHFRLSGHDPRDPKLSKIIEEAARVSEGYSPAEIRTAVKSSLRMAFRTSLQNPSRAQVMAALGEVTPLSRSMGETVTSLREWAASIGAKDAGKEV